MPSGCGCVDAGGSGSCIFSNSGNVTFSGSCATGVAASVSTDEVLDALSTGSLSVCSPFQVPVLQGGVWKLATISQLRCAQMV